MELIKRVDTFSTDEPLRCKAVYEITGSGDGYFAQGLQEGKSC